MRPTMSGMVNEARKKGTDRSFTIWIGGYITATNYNLKDTNDIVGSTDIDGMMVAPATVFWNMSRKK